MKRIIPITCSLIFALLLAGGLDHFRLNVVQAGGFIDFEDGTDGQPIRSSIPGLQFTTTQGYDWIYGDWRTGNYNGPYPSGSYYSNGNFFAWLGPNQGEGRIDFTEGCATYLQVWVSSSAGLNLDGYYEDGTMAATTSVGGNLDTGQLERMRVDAPAGNCFSYVIIHDTGNYWLIDDLSTDAGGVPSTRPPVVLIPGIEGSILRDNDTCQAKDYEVWPDADEMINSLLDKQLDHLKLQDDGITPSSNCDNIYTAGIIRSVSAKSKTYDFYGPLEDYLQNTMGFNVYAFDYDWRKDLTSTSSQLSNFIDNVLNTTHASQVNIVDHSMGGLVARKYVTSSAANAAKVEQVISVASPFLGAPKVLKILRYGDEGIPGYLWGLIGTYPPEIQAISQNFPAVYQLLPSSRYFNVNGGGYFSLDGHVWNASMTRSLIRSDNNSSLEQAAENFHSAAMDDWGSTTTTVAYRVIVGSGATGTPGLLDENTILNWNGTALVSYDILPTDGDGTVPITSAALQGNGYNYSGGVPIWYTKGLDHTGIIQEPYVMQFIGAMLATPPNAGAFKKVTAESKASRKGAPVLYKGAKSRFPVLPYSTDAVPPTPPEMDTSPFPIDGAQIEAFHVSALHVYDQSDNHTGPLPDGTIETGIPESSYTAIGDSVYITVPSGGTYNVKVLPEPGVDFDLRIRDLQGVTTNIIQRTIAYDSINADQAQLQYAPNNGDPAPQLALDTNNDGIPDASTPPSGDLGPAASHDDVPPSILVSLKGNKDSSGRYIGGVAVKITATDVLSGVSLIRYSVDSGYTIHTYTGPFTIQSDHIQYLLIQVYDKAGNEATKRVRIGMAGLPYPQPMDLANRNDLLR